MIYILIADDHALVREGIKKVLLEEMDFRVSGEAQNGRELFTLLNSVKVDILLLDITMPGRSGLEVLKDVKKLYPDLPVLILSMHPEERFALRAIKAGASGYLTKESATDELVNAIKKIIGGGRYLSDKLAVKLTEDFGKEKSEVSHEILSDREFEVMILIAKGKSLKEIGDQLSVGVTTVSTYRARILDKMGLNNNGELTYYAVSNRLID